MLSFHYQVSMASWVEIGAGIVRAGIAEVVVAVVDAETAASEGNRKNA